MFVLPASAKVAQTAAVIPVPPLPHEAPVALLVDLTSGQVLHARNPDRRFMPASVTKVMTLYLAFELIEAGRLDPAQVFVMSPAAARDWRRKGSTMFLEAGERVRVDDLLLGIANVSANDGAVVLAEGQAGSVPAWTAAMNASARSLGMHESRFASPNGWPDEGRTFTSANDLVRLARALIARHPDKFGYYIGRSGFDYKGLPQVNHDPLVGQAAGADGIKTGYTNEAGFSYLGTAQRRGRRLVMVLAGVESARLRARLAHAYLEWGFTRFERRRLFAPDAVVGHARVQGGDSRHVALVARGMAGVSVPPGATGALTATIRYDGPLQAPLAKGAQVAVLNVTAPGMAPANIPLFVRDPVKIAGPLDRVINALAGLFS
jgi:D-alanyl-D-alanine carboxypeptidase (penicillin-binding protein 5/6)